ncbi:MAG: acetylglutamate kinase [Succinivibrio sp.]|jgi:acetylglutamate kinase|nr:acetylglutamate kinase [Succinivibrio sp.]
MKDNTIVVKLSGKALGGVEELSNLFKSCKDQRLVVVHGGGVEVDALFKALNLEVTKKDGLRVSPKEQMPYISAALAGMCNKGLQALGIKSGSKTLGLLCSDGNTISVKQMSEDLGMVGVVEPASPDFLNMLLDNGYTPVIASLAHDENGELYNVNADDAALAIARVLEAPLYYISDVPGVLDKNGNLIDELDESSVKALIDDGTISGGMIVKVKSALDATRLIKKPVYIASYKDPNLCSCLVSRQRLGTVFNVK